MRPPICEVCDRDFAPPDGALLTCRPTVSDLKWRRRAEVEQMVGHPPDTGWFCGEHADAARALHERHTLTEVVAAVRSEGGSPALAPAPAPAAPEPAESVPGTSHTNILTLHAALAKALPAAASEVGLDPAAIARTSRRDWSPMDRTSPPNCPYVDYVTATVDGRAGELALRLEKAHWSEDEPARTHLTLALVGAGARDFRVAAWSPASGAPHAIEEVRVTGPVPAAVAEALG